MEPSSTLIRSESSGQARVRMFGAAEAPAPLDPLVEALELEIGTLRQTLALERDQHSQALDGARLEARAEAEREFVRDQTAALALLDASLANASDQLDRSLSGLEPLALLIARAALSAVFENVDDYGDLIERAVSRQISELRTGSVVSVEVSALDFPADADLARLAARFGNHISVKSEPHVGQGACTMQMRLGAVEIDIPGHWRALKVLFDELGESACS